MKLQLTFTLLLLLAMVGLTGCYTQLGYYASTDFDRKYHSVLEEELKHTSKTESKESESEAHDEDLEKHDDDTEASEGYYGRRKPTYRKRYVSPYRYDTYWGPYAPYWSYAHSPIFYYPHPWFSHYYRPYYGYYRSYYPYYRGYYPYTNVYRRYYSGSRYAPLSRRTYDRGTWRSENRRSRNSRSVTSPRSRSERPQRRIRSRNEN